MSKKSVTLSAEDYNYFIKLSDILKDYETKIAALEITKIKLFKEYELVSEKMEEFVGQLKIKYNIQATNAELDDATRSIVFDDESENSNENQN